MSAVATLRAQAEKLAEQLTKAQAKHAAEQAEIRGRNEQRSQEFWTKVRTETVPAALQAVADARDAFPEAVANGGDVAGAYATYCKAHAANEAIVNAACWALARFENDLTGEPNPPGDRTGRAVYPEGLTPSNDKPAEFVTMLQDATAAVAEAHARATLAELRQPLQDQLEAEDDE